jgi:3'-phosphoadenosine 5'-phosphosulfate sulfotransferase (PAPS reductase)/FAD synthetase
MCLFILGGIICFDENTTHLHFVNFSGGKDSTYLLLEMIRRNMPIDTVLNVDTGMEFPAMYDHINKVDDFLWAERGIRITRLSAGKTFRELMFEAVRKTKPSDVTGYGWPGAVVRWCTGQLKTGIIHNFTKDLPYAPYHYIAFAADEKKRLKRKNNQNPMYRYPLIKWGVTEARALAGCYEAGYTWDGLYEHFSRVSCWCCPLQSLKDLRTLRIHYPDIWALLRELDDQAIAQFGRDSPYGQFRPKESVRMLEVRFDFEREWAQAGGNIRSKAFYQALHHIYEEQFDLPPVSPTSPNELLRYLAVEDLPLDLAELGSHINPKKKRNKRNYPVHTR